jgi:hypothetical protein
VARDPAAIAISDNVSLPVGCRQCAAAWSGLIHTAADQRGREEARRQATTGTVRLADMAPECERQWRGSVGLFCRLLSGCEFRKDDSEIVESATALAAIRQPPALLQYNDSLAVNYRQVGMLRSSWCPCPGKDGCHCLVISDYLFRFLRRNLIPCINESQNRNIRGFCRLLH